MFNSKNLVKLIFLFFILIVIFGFLNKKVAKDISLDDAALDNEIVFVYNYQDNSGLAYSIKDIQEANNYIMGTSYNLYNNIQLFENCGDSIKTVETLGTSTDLHVFENIEDIDYSIFTFKSGNANYECKLGVELIHQDGSKTYRYLSEVH